MGFKAQHTIHFGFSRGSCTEKMRTIGADRMIAEETTKPDTIFLTLHGLEMV